MYRKWQKGAGIALLALMLLGSVARADHWPLDAYAWSAGDSWQRDEYQWTVSLNKWVNGPGMPHYAPMPDYQRIDIPHWKSTLLYPWYYQHEWFLDDEPVDVADAPVGTQVESVIEKWDRWSGWTEQSRDYWTVDQQDIIES